MAERVFRRLAVLLVMALESVVLVVFLATLLILVILGGAHTGAL